MVALHRERPADQAGWVAWLAQLQATLTSVTVESGVLAREIVTAWVRPSLTKVGR